MSGKANLWKRCESAEKIHGEEFSRWVLHAPHHRGIVVVITKTWEWIGTHVRVVRVWTGTEAMTSLVVPIGARLIPFRTHGRRS